MNKNLTMRVLGVIHKGIFIFCIPILCLSTAIGWEIVTPQVYTYGFDKYRVSETTDLYPYELKEIADELVTFFGSADDDLRVTIMKDGELVPLFTPEEAIHFQDVKGLIRLNRRLMLAALGYTALSIIWWRRKNLRQVGQVIMAGAGLTLGLLMALVLGVMLNFDQLFLKFHLISFQNDFWSAPGYMLKLFPIGFWYDIALFTVLVSSLLAVVIGGLGYGLMKFAGTRIANLS